MEKQYCPYCGAKITAEGRFCSWCGAQIIEENKEPDTPFDPFDPYDPYAPAQENAPMTDAPSECEKEPQRETPPLGRGAYAKGIVKRSIVTFVALLLVVFSFLPILNISVAASDVLSSAKGTAVLSIDSVRATVLSFDALLSYDMQTVTDSRAFLKAEELRDLLEYEANPLPLMGRILYYELRAYTQTDSFPFRAVHAIAPLLAFGYWILVFTLLLLSVSDLLSFILFRKSYRLGKTSAYILALIPGFVVLLYASFLYAYSAKIYAPSSISVTAILSIVFALAALICIAVFNKVKLKASEIVRRCFSCIAASVMLLSLFMPMFSFEVRTIFSGKENFETASVQIDPSFFECMTLTEDAKVTMLDASNSTAFAGIKDGFSLLSLFTKHEFISGHTNWLSSNILSWAFLGFGGVHFAGALSLIPSLMLLGGAVAVIILWQNLSAFAIRKRPRGLLTIPTRIIGLLTAVIILEFLILFLVISGYNLEAANFGTGYFASLSIGAGSIAMLVCSLVVTAIPMGRRKDPSLSSLDDSDEIDD